MEYTITPLSIKNRTIILGHQSML